MADEELLAAPRSATVAKKDDTIKPYEVETTNDAAQVNDEATSPASPVAPSVSVGVSSASPASAATAIASDDVPAAAHPTPDSASPTSHPVVSPPPNPSSPTPAQQQAPAPDASPVVDQLHAMFPTLDKETIADVLEGERGDADACVPLLLMLTGQGDAISVENVSRPGYGRGDQSHMEADEALARQLAQEESNAVSPNYSNLSYEPRRSRPNRAQQQQQQQNYDYNGQRYDDEEYDGNANRIGREDFDQVMETVKATADKAKQFGTGLFNSLQTKFKEMQLAREQQQLQAQQSESQWPSDNAQAASRVTDSYRAVGNAGTINSGRQGNAQRTNSIQRPSSQNMLSTSPSQHSGPPRISGNLPHSSRYARSSPSKQATQSSIQGTSPSNTAPINMRSSLASNQTESSSPDSHTSRGVSPNTALGSSPLAKSTLSDWPKQRISLVDNTSGTQQKRNVVDSDEDDLDEEYVRNPFEDRDD